MESAESQTTTERYRRSREKPKDSGRSRPMSLNDRTSRIRGTFYYISFAVMTLNHRATLAGNLLHMLFLSYVTVSLLKSLIIIYLPAVTHPHLNHLIWLLCPFTIAFKPRHHVTTSLIYKRLGGSSLFFCFDIPAVLFAATNIVNGASNTPTYFRIIEVVVSV